MIKSIIGFTIVLAAQLLPVQAAAAEAMSAKQSTLAFLSARFEAMIEEGVSSLERYLADDLTCLHTTGWTE